MKESQVIVIELLDLLLGAPPLGIHFLESYLEMDEETKVKPIVRHHQRKMAQE